MEVDAFGAKGALPVLIDGWAGAAWIHRREVKVAFVFDVVPVKG